MNENKCPRRSNLRRVLLDIQQYRVLLPQQCRIEVYHGYYLKIVGRHSSKLSTRHFIPIGQRLVYDKIISVCCLFYNPHSLKDFNKGRGAAIHNGHLRTVNLQQNIVNPKAKKS